MTGYKSKRAAAQDKLDSMEREALKLALEALVCLKRDFAADQFEWEITDVAITAIKEALAQPAQEPVAWVGLTPFDFENLEQLYLHKVANEFVLSDIICTVESKLKEKNK